MGWKIWSRSYGNWSKVTVNLFNFVPPSDYFLTVNDFVNCHTTGTSFSIPMANFIDLEGEAQFEDFERVKWVLIPNKPTGSNPPEAMPAYYDTVPMTRSAQRSIDLNILERLMLFPVVEWTSENNISYSGLTTVLQCYSLRHGFRRPNRCHPVSDFSLPPKQKLRWIMHFLGDSVWLASLKQNILSTIKVRGQAGELLWFFNITRKKKNFYVSLS